MDVFEEYLRLKNELHSKRGDLLRGRDACLFFINKNDLITEESRETLKGYVSKYDELIEQYNEAIKKIDEVYEKYSSNIENNCVTLELILHISLLGLLLGCFFSSY